MALLTYEGIDSHSPMPEPFLWTVVITGAWNQAILSPDGIRRRLFNLPDDIPVEIELAMDRPGYFRVGNRDLWVVPTSNSLEVVTKTPTSASLEEACALSRRALEALPETPVSAAGINIRYAFPDFPNQILDLIQARLDTALSDSNFEIKQSLTNRTLIVGSGVLNLRITHEVPTGGGTLQFNFHRDSTLPTELSDWLNRVAEFLALSDQVLAIMGVHNVRREVHA